MSASSTPDRATGRLRPGSPHRRQRPALARGGLLAIALAAATVATPAAAAGGPGAAAGSAPAAASGSAAGVASPAEIPLTAAEVRRVDRAAARLTLRHEEIRHIDMPPMTMVFAVADAAMLEGLSPGMAVLVRVERREGGLVITRIEPVRR